MTTLYIAGHFQPVTVTDSAAEILTTKEQILKLSGINGETVWCRVPDIAVVIDSSTATPPETGEGDFVRPIGTTATGIYHRSDETSA